jgi:hypothetical protein
MTYSFNLSTDVGKVRLMIPDRDEANRFFEDDELSTFLTLEVNNIRRAAALSLETMASDQAMVLKVTKILDLSVDGTRVATSLMERAKLLRDQATFIEEQGDAGFDVAETVGNDFAYRDVLYKDWLRNG